MIDFKRKVPLGDYIRWSKMIGDGQTEEEFFTEMATPTDEDIEQAKAEVVPELRPFLEAEEKEDE